MAMAGITPAIYSTRHPGRIRKFHPGFNRSRPLTHPLAYILHQLEELRYEHVVAVGETVGCEFGDNALVTDYLFPAIYWPEIASYERDTALRPHLRTMGI